VQSVFSSVSRDKIKDMNQQDNKQSWSRFWRGNSFYSSVLSLPFMFITFALASTFADAWFFAKNHVDSDANRAIKALAAAIATGTFFLGICIHRLRTKQVLQTHPTDAAVLKQMALALIGTTCGFCFLVALLLHPIL
jgi:hypothetical protein